MYKLIGTGRCRSRRRAAISSVLGFVLLAPALVAAQPHGAGGYIGAGIGQSTMIDADTTFIGMTRDDTDSAVKLFGGYMFDRNVGLELEFIDFGSFLGAAPAEEWSATGFNFSLIGALPLPDPNSNFSLFGKAGANVWNVDDDFPSSASFSTSGTNLSYGIGAQLDFNPNVSANVQWQRFNNVGDPAITGRSDLRLVTLNLVYHFRWWGGRRY